jgi:hypothetical protein
MSNRGVHTGRFRRELAPDDRDDRSIGQTAMRRAKEGDHEAVRLLYLRYADNVHGYIASIVRDEPRDIPLSVWLMRGARNRGRPTCGCAARRP